MKRIIACFLLFVGNLFAQAILPGTTVNHSQKMREIWKNNQWNIQDETLFREYIEPQTSLGEPAVDWLPVLKPLAEKMSKGAKTPLQAAVLINQKISKTVGVIYSTKRDRANQDPLHSMRIGMASCSGLSILLVDCCRSIAVPARIVGCLWRKKPGNHSWVEVWSEGNWYTLCAFEGNPPNDPWFKIDASQADANDPRYSIYATRATLTPQKTIFYGWNVPADNVTARYKISTAPSDLVRVHIAAEKKGERVEIPFRVNGKSYLTPGPLRDKNDYTTLVLPKGSSFIIDINGKQIKHQAKDGAIYIFDLDKMN